MPGVVAVDRREADAERVDLRAHARRRARRGRAARTASMHGARGRADAAVGRDGVVVGGRAVAVECGHASAPTHLPSAAGAPHWSRHEPSFAVALATVAGLRRPRPAPSASSRCSTSGDDAPPVLVERLEDGALQVTEDARAGAPRRPSPASRRCRSADLRAGAGERDDRRPGDGRARGAARQRAAARRVGARARPRVRRPLGRDRDVRHARPRPAADGRRARGRAGRARHRRAPLRAARS